MSSILTSCPVSAISYSRYFYLRKNILRRVNFNQLALHNIDAGFDFYIFGSAQ